MALFEAQNIQVTYKRGGHPFTPLNDVSFALEAGSIYDLTGPSGSGKTTLLNACARMLQRAGGMLLLNGVASEKFSPVEWRRRVCLVPQQASMVPGSVRDNLLLAWKLKVNAGLKLPSDATLTKMLALVDLPDVELDRDASQLSGGQFARVAVLRAFLTRPQVLLLDEVDAALDPDSACAVGRLTKELVDENTTCIRIRHRSADGFEVGIFTLDGGRISYQNSIPNTPAKEA